MRLTVSFTLATLLIANFYTGAVPVGPQRYFGEVKPTGDMNVFAIEYDTTFVYMDCIARIPRMAMANVRKHDQNITSRSNEVYFERSLKPECQPKTTIEQGGNYAQLFNEEGYVYYNNGNLIPQSAINIADNTTYANNINAMKVTNFFPIHRQLSSGPWETYTTYIQCLRANTSFALINGLIMPKQPNTELYGDYGILIPEFVWSAILLPNKTIQVFMFSNSPTTRGVMTSDIKRYIITAASLERVIGFTLPNTGGYNKEQPVANINLDMSKIGCTQN
jgi:hypothetical protein